MTTTRIRTDRATRSRLVSDSGPSTQTTTGRWVDWGNAEDILGQPFDNTRLPFSKLYQMRRDPMIAFGLLFAKLPLVRAPWYIKCSDARIAAFVDNALRAIYGRFIFQYSNSLDFGFAPMEKRFELLKPTWQYEKDGEMIDVWDSRAEALVWKSFSALKPDICEPWWNDDGEFDGILFRVPNESTVDFSKGNLGNQAKRRATRPDIPLEKALWATNEKDSVFGSLWGFPRVAYAYRYWWSYWYRWALADRHFEKDSDPPAVVWFPSGGEDSIDADGNEVDNSTIALALGENARSGSTIALPSEVIMGFDDKPTNTKKWGIEFLEGGGNFNAFEQTFAYLDVAKLRAVMVPEQAFLEGQGGTSSRNVAETLSDVFFSSQAVLMQEIDAHINRYMIPQLVEANFGKQAPPAEKVTRGFASQDMDTIKAIIQLFGQADPTTLEVDMREILKQLNIPLLTPQQVEQEKQKAAQEAQQSQPPQTNSSNGYAGVNQWGFYEQPREIVKLESTIDDEKIELAEWIPDTPHFEDAEIKALAQEFNKEWEGIFGSFYDAYATAIEHVEEVALSEEKMLLLARSEDEANKYVDKFLESFALTPQEREKQVRRVAGWLRSIMDLAGRKEVSRLRVTDAKWDVESPDVVEWSRKHAGELVTTAGRTTKRELRKYITQKLAEPGWDWKDIAAGVREKFPRKWPGWKADRVARTETMLAYNTAGLMAYEQNGITHVRAHDAAIPERSDPDCIARNGKIFTLADAWKEQAKEHPNGTLSWSPLPMLVPTSIQFSEHDGLTYKGQPTKAYIDKETYEVHFDSEITDEEMGEFLTALSERLDLGPFSTLKKVWDEKKVKRGADGRFTFKPGQGSGGQGVPGISNQPQRSVAPSLAKTPQGKKAIYDDRKKALEKRVSKQVKKGTRKDPAAEKQAKAGYTADAQRNAAGKVNQKALLVYAERASSSQHVDADGNVVIDAKTTVDKYRVGFSSDGSPIYSAARREVHERIIDAFLRERGPNGELDPQGKPLPSQKDPKVLFTGGGYSAGKGYLVDRLFPDQGRVPEDGFTLDPDKIKAALPEFSKLIETDPEANLALYQEAWDIAQEVQRRGQERKINMVVDGIADTSPDEIIARAQSFADAGYKNVDLAYVDVSTEEAMKRAKARAENPKAKISDRRYIPEVIMRSVHRDVAATIDEVFKRLNNGEVDIGVPFKVEVYNNEDFVDEAKGDKWTGFTYPKLIASGENGKVDIVEPESFAKTLAKRNESIPGVSEQAVPTVAKKQEAKVGAKVATSDNPVAKAIKEVAGGEAEIEPELGVWAYKWSAIIGHILQDPHLQEAMMNNLDVVRALMGLSEDQLDALPSECVEELDYILFAEGSGDE